MTVSPQNVLPLAPDRWDPSLGFILEEMKGAPLHVHQLMANNPLLLKAWWSFRNYSVNGGSLGKRKGELVILRVAAHMRAWYEWASHVDRSLACGITLEEINAVLNVRVGDSWSNDEAILLKSVDELIRNQQISPDTLRILGEHFDTAQIMDIMAIHGMYVILACMIKTWGLELDPAVAERIKGVAQQDDFVSSSNKF